MFLRRNLISSPESRLRFKIICSPISFNNWLGFGIETAFSPQSLHVDISAFNNMTFLKPDSKNLCSPRAMPTFLLPQFEHASFLPIADLLSKKLILSALNGGLRSQLSQEHLPHRARAPHFVFVMTVSFIVFWGRFNTTVREQHEDILNSKVSLQHPFLQ